MKTPGQPRTGSPETVLRGKGAPLGESVTGDRLRGLDWHLTDARTTTPVALVRREAVANNIEVMAQFCARHDVRLAPHAKTTMSRQLVAQQVAAGAWAMTVAVPYQVATLVQWGQERILVANEVVGESALRWFGAAMVRNPDLEILWYVDSLAGIAAADGALHQFHTVTGHTASVLVEVGHAGGRTGVRTVEEALTLARAVDASVTMHLAGVAGYEGTVSADRSAESIVAVRSFLSTLRQTYVEVHAEGLVHGVGNTGSGVVTAGGSAFFDEVARELWPLRGLGAEVVLRSGCYLTHDHGFYERLSPDRTHAWPFGSFLPALEVWGTVISRPEPGLALLDLGRRDVSFDQGLPVPVARARRGVRQVTPADGLTVTSLSDQHAFLTVPVDDHLAVGDLVGVGVSHPCTTFDHWRTLLVVDEHRRVVDLVDTSF